MSASDPSVVSQPLQAARAARIAVSRLAGWPGLLGFGVVLTGMLALVFPTGEEYADLASVKTPDRYSIAYLEVLTRANPEEIELQLVYVKQLTMLGRFSEALELLGPALADPKTRAQAMLARFDLRLAHARSIPEGEPLRDETFALVLSDIEALLALKHDAPRLRELATVALELERPKIASEYLVRLSDVSEPSQRPAVLAEAAKWLRASGDGNRASEMYDRASQLTTDPAASRAYGLASVTALEAEDEVAKAADRAAEYVNKFPNDVDVLLRAMALATACSRHAAARDFGRRVLAFSPDDQVPDTLLRAQAKRELAAADPKSALALVRRLVARHPSDPELRESEAYVAEWAGDLELALKDWLYLMQNGRNPSSRTGPRL